METITTSPLRKWLVALVVVVAAVIVGILVRLVAQNGTEPAGTPGDGTTGRLTIPISVPPEWKGDDGALAVPENIKLPEEAVAQVTQIKGYESASSARAFLGDDGQWYWEVRTPGGVMTVKATSTSTPPTP